MKTQEMVIIKQPFQGYAQTFCTGEKVMYSKLTLTAYMAQDPDLQRVSWQQFNEMHEAYYKAAFVEIPKDRYQHALCELPPLKWHGISPRFTIFYCSEAMSGEFHSMYVADMDHGKYYSGMKSIRMSDEQILKEIEIEILNGT